MTTPFKYIRRYYGVPADYNRRVVVDGKPGIIIKDCGNYIGVNFDDEKPWVVSNCHPTWHVEYGELGTPRRLTRSQQRYQDFLDADYGGTFREYLRELSRRAARQ